MTAFNFATNTEYSGRNATLEGNGKYPAFATFNQLRSLGYSVNKGAKGVHISCGFKQATKKDEKTGETKTFSVPRGAVVFDIIDTNALQDADLVEFLENGQRIPSELQINQELAASLLGGAKGAEAVSQAYETKEVSAVDMMRGLGVEVVQIG
jgi:hypothetical protein